MFKKLHIYQQISFIFVIWLSIGAVSEAFAYRQVMAGPRQTCAIKNNGNAVCWGQVNQTFSEHTFTQIFAGYYGRTIGLKTNGSIINLGNLYSGWNATELPTQENFTQFGASWSGGNICGLKTDGTIKCFGDDTWGLASPPEGIFTQLSMGGGKACGLKIDGTVSCWGHSWDASSPAGINNTPPTGVSFTKISVGDSFHACGLRVGDGAAICWGANDYGQSAPPKDSFAQLSAGSITLVD